MPFVKGQSGNPYGRPPGIRDERTKTSLRAARVAEEQEEVRNRERSDEGEENEVRNRGGSSVGVYILLLVVLAILILLLLDRFVFEGKIFARVFVQSKPEDQSEVTEQKLELRGFQGRSLDTL
ncbi:MAG: hypothetical protein GH144_03300 [Clostridia bacterium]|nr:hypothetical protein [Clostridia bacterium]